jgi:hypothetical protein
MRNKWPPWMTSFPNFRRKTSEIEEAEAAVGEEDSAVVQLVNKIILDAYARGASDIHIEPYPGKQNTRGAHPHRRRLRGLSDHPLQPTRMPSSPVSRSCPIWISPNGANPRTARSSSKSTGAGYRTACGHRTHPGGAGRHRHAYPGRRRTDSAGEAGLTLNSEL